MKKILIIATVLFATTAFAQKFEKTKSGLEYVIVKPNKGERIKNNDVVFVDLSYANAKDSILFDNKKVIGQPVQLIVSDGDFKGDLNDALKLLTLGDSGIFKINADSLFQKTFRQPLPPFIEKGTALKFYIKVNKVTNQDALLREQQAEAEMKEKEETVVLSKYIADNKLQPEKTESGLQYVITQAATGPKPENGKTVVVHYTGRLVNGQKFDSSVDRNEPFEFTIGVGQVIKGWDEGIALLNKGAKATLLIPSKLGYGARGAGGSIGPFEPLIFDVELIDIK